MSSFPNATRKSLAMLLLPVFLTLNAKAQVPEFEAGKLLWRNDLVNPKVEAIVDLDNDGLKDVLFSYAVFDAGIIWNEGGGNFSEPEIFDPSYDYSKLSVADFDQDGDMDLVFGTFDPFIYLKENLGQRDFELSYLMNGFFQGLGDMEGDGDIDLLVQSQPSQLSWVIMQGLEEVEERLIAGDLVANLFSIEIEDLDGNGLLDVMTMDESPSLRYWLQREGLFEQYDFDTELPQLYNLVLGDLNADQIPEIIAHRIQATGEEHAVLLQFDGDNSYNKISSLWPNPTYHYAIGDVTGDGHQDIMVSSFVDENIYFLAGDGNLEFDAPELYGSGPFSLSDFLLADMHGDGNEQLVAGSILSDGIYYFSAPQASALTLVEPVLAEAYSLIHTDLDGDQIADILIGSRYNGQLLSLRGFQDGSFEYAQPYIDAGSSQQLLAGKFLPEGGREVWLLNFEDKKIQKLSTIPGAPVLETLIDNTTLAQQLHLADLDQDGQEDLIILGRNRKVYVYPAISSGTPADSVLLQDTIFDGNGDLLAPTQLAIATHPQPRLILGMDHWAASGETYIEKTNLVDWAFTDSVFIHQASQPSKLWLSDLNGDEIQDLVIDDCGSFTLAMRDGQGYETTTTELQLSPKAFGKFGPDPELDMLGSPCGTVFQSQMFYVDNEVIDGPAATLTFTAEANISKAYVHDVDNDGDDDLLLTVNNHTALYLYKNTTYSTGFENRPDLDFKLYPNPSAGKLTIEHKKTDVSAQIFDLQLRLVDEFSLIGTKTIRDISQLSSGLYIVKVGAKLHKLLQVSH